MKESAILDYTNILIRKSIELGVEFAPKLLGAIAVLFIGILVINKFNSLLNKALTSRSIDISLTGFLTSILKYSMYTMLVLAIMNMLGIAMTSFVAILGAAGLAVGMALSGTLQNFAGGVIILILRPYKVADVIELQGYIGSVNSIQIFHTVLKTADNKTIIIPNSAISSGSLVNYTMEPHRRLEWVIGVAYGTDITFAKKLISEILLADERILKEPAIQVVLGDLADSSLNIFARAWVSNAEYWNVFFDVNEKVYNKFNENNISIPFPQLDVHVRNMNK